MQLSEYRHSSTKSFLPWQEIKCHSTSSTNHMTNEACPLSFLLWNVNLKFISSNLTGKHHFESHRWLSSNSSLWDGGGHLSNSHWLKKKSFLMWACRPFLWCIHELKWFCWVDLSYQSLLCACKMTSLHWSSSLLNSIVQHFQHWSPHQMLYL